MSRVPIIPMVNPQFVAFWSHNLLAPRFFLHPKPI